MSVRLARSLAVASSAAFLFALAPLAQSQPASAPAATAAPAPAAAPAADASEGKVAYYGRKFAGRKTASGERFNPGALTMAHKTLPFGTMVRVTNLKNKKSVVVRVNDRGPTTPDRIGDVTSTAARKLGMLRSGVVEARLEVVGQARRGVKGKTGKKANKA